MEKGERERGEMGIDGDGDGDGARRLWRSLVDGTIKAQNGQMDPLSSDKGGDGRT